MVFLHAAQLHNILTNLTIFSYVKNYPDGIPTYIGKRGNKVKIAQWHLKNSLVALQNSQTRELLQCTMVDVTGTPVENGSLEIEPYESKFFRVEWQGV
jgi:hypothetical protein